MIGRGCSAGSAQKAGMQPKHISAKKRATAESMAAVLFVSILPSFPSFRCHGNRIGIKEMYSMPDV